MFTHARTLSHVREAFMRMLFWYTNICCAARVYVYIFLPRASAYGRCSTSCERTAWHQIVASVCAGLCVFVCVCMSVLRGTILRYCLCAIKFTPPERSVFICCITHVIQSSLTCERAHSADALSRRNVKFCTHIRFAYGFGDTREHF